METTPQAVPNTEAAAEAQIKLPEGKFAFSNPQKERGLARVENNGGELKVVMVAPMEGQFTRGQKKTLVGPDGKNHDVLDVALLALSPQSTEGAALMHLQLDRDTITRLLVTATEQGVLPKAESQWAPGGKMEQMAAFAIKWADELDKRG